MEEKEFREKVVKGITVNWYPKAILNKEPKVAMVYSANSNGSVNLCVFDEGGTYRVHASYHKSCKSSLYDHAGQKQPHVVESGCWDFNEMSALLYQRLKESQERTNCPDCGVLVGQTEGSDEPEGDVPDGGDGKPAVRRRR